MDTVVLLTAGEPGVGKSYRRCAHFLINDWLADSENRVHYSNFPVDIEAIKAFTGREDIEDRIKVIPKEEMDRWERGVSGPWEYFKETPLSCCHIAIDEFDHFCPKKNKKIVEDWALWLKEIRHQGATVEFIVQGTKRVADELHPFIGKRIALSSAAHRPDPYFKIPMYDWYQIRSKILGREVVTIIESEYRKLDEKFVLNKDRPILMQSKYFGLYDSHSQPQRGGVAGKSKRKEWERFGWPMLLLWFAARNYFQLMPRVFFLCIFLWLTAFGGFTKVFSTLVNATKIKTNQTHVEAKPEAEPPILEPTTTTQTPIQYKPDDSIIHSKNQTIQAQQLKIDKFMQELAAVKSELEQYKTREANAKQIVLIGDEYIALKTGAVFRIGEELPWGIKLNRVDMRKMQAEDESGEIYTLSCD